MSDHMSDNTNSPTTLSHPAFTAEASALLFDEARTHSAWQGREVEDSLLVALYERLRVAPTAMNCQPLRVHFVRSPEAKERLKGALSAGNVDKTMSAPVTAILAFDGQFHEHLPTLFPHWEGAKAHVKGMSEEARFKMAEHSATLQAGYFILAARSFGLDCGPMGGFDAAKVNELFFEGRAERAFLLVNLGYGEPSKLHPRAPRLGFEKACALL